MPNDEYTGHPGNGGGHGSGAPVFGPPSRMQRDEGLDVAQLWLTVRDNYRIVLLVAIIVFGAVMTFTFSSRMTFRSMGRLYLGEISGKAQSGELDLTSNQNSEVGSEIEVLRSRSMVKRAIVTSGMNVSIRPPGWHPPRFWRWMLAKRDRNAIDPTSGEIGATDASLPEDAKQSRDFKVKFTSPTDYKLWVESRPPAQGKLGEPLTIPGLSLTLVPGARRSPSVGAEYEITVSPLDQVAQVAIDSLQVTVPKATSGGEPVRVLSVEFWSGSPYYAAEFIRHLMQSYLAARQAWKTEDAAAAEAFVTKQLHGMQESLDRTQAKLADYRTENRVVVLANEADAMVQQIGKYEEQRVAARLQVEALKDIQRALNNRGAPLEAYMAGEAGDAVLRELGSTLSTARQQLTELEGRFKGAAPEVQQQRAKVTAQLRMIDNYVSNRLSRAKENLAALDGIIAQFESKLKTVPSAELGLAQIGRESEVYSRMYSYLLERQQQAAIIKASTVSKNRILDLPEEPLREDSPKLGLHLGSSILGLLLGAAIVIIRTLFSGVFRHEADVRALVGPVPVFASVPQRVKLRTRKNGASHSPPLFDALAQPSDLGFAEAFRSLRTKLYRALSDGHGRVILVTSASPGDGKTTCALALAAMLAADNKRVLVIDGDVRKPTHHLLTGLPQEPGLRDLVLRVQPGWRDAVHTAQLTYGWFDSISAGAAGHAELLSDGYFATFLVNIRAQYDFIILDAAGYPVVSDALMLAPMADFVLSVMRLGNTPRRLAEEHLHGMFAVARGFAVVVNNGERTMVYEPVRPLHPRSSVVAAPSSGPTTEASRDRLQ
jgi:tyrosine-protein kinase Etk/Wzc